MKKKNEEENICSIVWKKFTYQPLTILLKRSVMEKANNMGI